LGAGRKVIPQWLKNPSATYYDILGVQPQANQRTIKKAYYSLAMEWHPDRNPGDRRAEAITKKLNSAYAILSDLAKRKEYDFNLGLNRKSRFEAPETELVKGGGSIIVNLVFGPKIRIVSVRTEDGRLNEETVMNFIGASEVLLAAIGHCEQPLEPLEACNVLNKRINAAPWFNNGIIPLPDMISHPRLPFTIAKSPATNLDFWRLLEGGYKVWGINKHRFLFQVARCGKEGVIADWTSMGDGRCLAGMLNIQNPGRELRVQTSTEHWLAEKHLGHRLMGKNVIEWTEDDDGYDGDGQLFDRAGSKFINIGKHHHYARHVIRLAENKKS